MPAHVPSEDAVVTPYDCGRRDRSQVFDLAGFAAMPLVVDTRNALKAFARLGIFRL